MNCPVCSVALTMTERQGVEIDYCPKCRGVWLDRGELDKIIDRSTDVQPQQPQQPLQQQPPPPPPPRSGYDNRGGGGGDDRHYERERHYDREHEHSDHYKKKKKRESFLGELFDF